MSQGALCRLLLVVGMLSSLGPAAAPAGEERPRAGAPGPAIRAVRSEIVHESATLFQRLRGPLSTNSVAKFDAEQQALLGRRPGHYLTVLWDARTGGVGPCQVRLTFVQERGRASAQMQVRFEDPAASGNEAQFAVVGPRFASSGPVRSWKVELLVGDQVVDSRSSGAPAAEESAAAPSEGTPPAESR